MMKRKEVDYLFKKAIDLWGKPAQINMIEEECIELAHAICKLRRERGSMEKKIDSLVDELADVTIMMDQSKIVFADLQDRVNERIEFKLNRLKQRIEEDLS